MDELFTDLNLKPIILSANRNRFRNGREWITPSNESHADLYKEFTDFKNEASPIWRLFKKSRAKIPLTDPQLLKLDSERFSQHLRAHSAEFIGLIDSMCKEYNCTSVDSISALAGYAITEDLVLPAALFKGGNTAIARALADSIQDRRKRCQVEAFVWSVEIKDAGASVVYSDKSQTVHRVNCRYVIVTSPPMVSARILKNVGNDVKAKMLSFRYGSYLVANCLLKQPVFKGTLENWCTTPFDFADILIAEIPYQELGEYSRSMGSVLTIYKPYTPGSEGRTLLLEGDRGKLTRSLIEQLQPLTSGLSESLERVVLTRWGHAMLAVDSGYFGRMTKLSQCTDDSYSLAHNSTQGLACAESAIRAAKQAVDNALRKATSSSLMY